MILKHHAPIRPRPQNRAPTGRNRACRGKIQAGNHRQHCGLPTPRRPKNRHKLPLGHSNRRFRNHRVRTIRLGDIGQHNMCRHNSIPQKLIVTNKLLQGSNEMIQHQPGEANDHNRHHNGINIQAIPLIPHKKPNPLTPNQHLCGNNHQPRCRQ